MNMSNNSVTPFDSIQEIIKKQEHRKLQWLMSDVTYLLLVRIYQLSKAILPQNHLYFKYCGRYMGAVNEKPQDHHSISKQEIVDKLNKVFSEIFFLTGLDSDMFYPVFGRDVVCLEEMLISSITRGTVPSVSDKEILSRFLWIVFAKVKSFSLESIKKQNGEMTLEAICYLTNKVRRSNQINYKWKGFVMDAALLAKSKAERDRDMTLSMEMNGYNISARVINYIIGHEKISINEIQSTLQTALDMILFKQKNNGKNVYELRSNEVQWFCSLFDNNDGKILIPSPQKTTHQDIILKLGLV